MTCLPGQTLQRFIAAQGKVREESVNFDTDQRVRCSSGLPVRQFIEAA
jgi:hypothetical protein